MHPRDSFWAVTCHFNPAGFAVPRRNYETFARRLAAQGVRLLTVELTLPGQEGLPDLADVTVRLRGGPDQVLWQKERLLSHGIALLPGCCHFAAWVDADLLWADDDWHQRAFDLLRRHDVIQLYDRCHRLTAGVREVPAAEWPGPQPGSVAYFGKLGPDPRNLSHPGYAWAARRSWLKRVGLYDRAVLGSGDLYFSKAVLGDAQWVYNYAPLDDDLSAYGRSVKETNPRVAAVETPVYHLHHGELANRRYERRHDLLIEHGFDPRTDIRLRGGAWAWATPKPALHRAVAEYFLSRKEDE